MADADRKKCGRLGYGNARNAREYTVDGVTDTLSGWAQRLGCTYHTLYKRICLQGRSPEEAIRTGSRKINRTYLTINGETHTIAEWARRTGVDQDRISSRIGRGWTPAEAVGIEKHDNPVSRYVTYRGRRKTVCEWARELGLDYEAFRQRVLRHERGEMPLRAVFSKGSLSPWRIVRRTKHQNWYRGRRITIEEICRRKGCSRTWVSAMFRAGYTATQILDNPSVAPVRDTAEMQRRQKDSYQRNKRLRELKRLGLIV